MRDELSFIATAIGSMPHTAAEPALDIIFDTIPSCPLWPRLPKRGFHERTEVQFSEGLPGIVSDAAKERIFFDTTDEKHLTDTMFRFYESYLQAEATDEWAAFRISEKCAAGIPALEKLLKRTPVSFLKVQTAGPVTMGMNILDENGCRICRNEAFLDVLVKGLTAKCRWQLKKFTPYARQLLCFIDEPVFATFGSQLSLPLSHYKVVTIINEMVEGIHAAGALCGLHCCGKTEWTIPVEAGVDIISFDAYEFGETITLYPRQIKKHLEAGGYIAWGIVPASEKIFESDVPALLALYDGHVERLSSLGIDPKLVHERSIITPSCGCGTLTENAAKRVFELLGETAARLAERVM
ncbi:MAG: hypothetical protein JW913_05540 [Chitinispirillaceae bacterium]|nr:hypothetical protein [Chitinispirillaceae bacterium]